MSGPSFRDYHLLLDEQADQIFATVDPIAERVRKLGGTTLRSTGHAARLQRLSDNDADFVTPIGMLAELREDNQRLAGFIRATHGCATSTATWPPPACWRTGSTRPSDAPGSSSSRCAKADAIHFFPAIPSIERTSPGKPGADSHLER